MRIILKPLFDVELPAGFEEIIRSKLRGKEVKTGETVEIDLLGKPLTFKVVLADPSPMKVSKNTRIEIKKSEVNEITIEFDEEVRKVLPFSKGLVIVLQNDVRIYNWNGQKLYSREFEELKEVRVAEGKVVVVHGNRVTLIEP
ncbi:MAG: hypothetical protein PWP49_735 [Thermococcaceae archaeon]|jgi:hypothetical protein|uniref:DUF6849 domain-containing protein n=1 Tax=Thermococcus sp. 101 C5 TaxID=2654197 RepID=UPI00128CA628|nr:ATPase [Thermococcus sp. 101 C5]MDK2782996.1 hypothetical protein [Thermococcaceae archaeon]MDK2853817.1 hypothetical protein [Thermococcaceae archaeon]MDN5320315.1 hypothetical protein [Thermococcaceae archaeon]MPW39570.1 ATPase [Thermococcus sp. 101 C5]